MPTIPLMEWIYRPILVLVVDAFVEAGSRLDVVKTRAGADPPTPARWCGLISVHIRQPGSWPRRFALPVTSVE